MSTPSESPEVWTVLSYLRDTFGLQGAVRLLRDGDLGFEPVEATIEVLDGPDVTVEYGPGLWQRVDETDGACGLRLTGPREGDRPRDELSYSTQRTGERLMLGGAVRMPETLLERLLAVPGLITGAAGDWNDLRWQGEENPKHYQFWYPGDWSHVRLYTDKRGRQRIDVSQNPGRHHTIGVITLWAAQDVWFGPASAVAIDYDAVGTLPVGRVEEVGDGVLHVHLYDGPADSPAAREAQHTLRKHLGYDDAVARRREIIAALAGGADEQDPRIIVRHGSFPHGGTRLVYNYWTEQKRRTVRSRATWLTVAEYDGSEQLDWQEIDLRTQPHPDVVPPS